VTAELDGGLVLPEHEGWDVARRAWNLAVDQRPMAVALPESVEDVAAAIRLARERGWRVAPQATGHRAAALGALDGALLLKTERMRGVAIDPGERVARVEAGALWQDVTDAAAEHGLVGLAGSGPDVGVVGYALAGGIGWLGRLHGLAANSVTAVEAVTPDGRLVRADAGHEPELFWALRGGAGNGVVVTALELRLFPLAEVHAGILWWPLERGEEVLAAWRALCERGVPDGLSTIGRFLRYPPIPEIPEPQRGRSFVVVEAAHIGERDEADALLEPLRALGPERDTIATRPAHELIELHMDPTQPVPGASDGVLLSALPAEALDEIVRRTGPGADTPLLSLELRQLGGELARPRPDGGAVSSLDAGFVLVGVGIAPTPEHAVALRAHIDELRDALRPWTAPLASLNFADSPREPRTLWSAESHARLRRVKAALDPDDVIRAAHPL
jgi:hypothetical protein